MTGDGIVAMADLARALEVPAIMDHLARVDVTDEAAIRVC